MKITNLKLSGLCKIEPRVYKDNRGLFVKQYQEDIFKEFGLELKLAEQYFSVSRKNVIRGLHFQLPPQEHEKFVYCISGAVFDVVVDLRKSSSTYGYFYSVVLDSVNCNALFIPKGFAHGFCSLVDNTCMVYNVSTVYTSELDAGIKYNSCGISWPIPDPIVNERDSSFPSLEEFKSPF